MTAPADLAAVRAALDLAAKATPGPWRTFGRWPHLAVVSGSDRPRIVASLSSASDDVDDTPRDAAAIVALRNAAPAIAELCAEVERLRGDKAALVKHIDYNPSLRIRELEATRAKLAEAKRLGMEACALVHSAIDNAPDPTSNDPGDRSAIAAGHSVADRIAAALEAL